MDEEDLSINKCLNMNSAIDRCYILQSLRSPSSTGPPSQQQQQQSQNNTARDISIYSSKLQTFFVQVLVLILFSPFVLFFAIMAIFYVLIEKANKAIQRRHQMHNQTTNTQLSDYSLEEDLRLGVVSLGFSPIDLQKLPCINYPSRGTSTMKEYCTVCLEGLREGERCRLLPKCKHVFHADCVDSWLIRVSACPICRGVVDEPQTLADGFNSLGRS